MIRCFLADLILLFVPTNTAEGRGAATVQGRRLQEWQAYGGRDGRRTKLPRPLDEAEIERPGFGLGRAVGWAPRGEDRASLTKRARQLGACLAPRISTVRAWGRVESVTRARLLQPISGLILDRWITL